MTRATTESLASRRARARTQRSATEGPAGEDRTELAVLLPSTDAATILLLCEQAAELTG